MPKTILRAFEVYADGELVLSETKNYQRLVNVPLHRMAREVRFVPRDTWGAEDVRIYAVELMVRP